MNKIAKALKWGASALRVDKMCVVAGNWLKIASDKPLYLGKGARVYWTRAHPSASVRAFI